MDISRTHLIEDLNSSMEGQDVLFGGWVVDLRKLGKMAFLTVRDVTGMCQVIVKGDAMSLLESIPVLSKNTKPKYIPGTPPNLVNPTEGCKFYDRCPEAMEKCKKTPPKIKTKSGYVLCWLYE